MSRLLSPEQISRFERDGIVYPIPILTPGEAAEMRQRFEALEQAIEGEAVYLFRIKAHLPFPWLTELIRHPRLLDAVEDLIGPDIVVWGSTFFAKKARDPRYVSWHQDSTYYGLEPHESINIWLAFTDSNVGNGCLRVIPRSHKGPGIIEHVETRAADNLLSRGQTIVGIDDSTAIDVELKAGECSIHHDKVIHGSNPNLSDGPRIGYAIHVAPAHVRQTQYEGATATLVRGRDRNKNWLPDPVPERDFDPRCMAEMEQALNRYRTRMRTAAQATDDKQPGVRA